MEKKKKYSSEKHSGSRQKTKYKKKDSLKQDLQKDVKKDSKDSKKDVERSDEKNNKKDKKKVSKKSVEKKPVEETSVPVGHKEKETEAGKNYELDWFEFILPHCIRQSETVVSRVMSGPADGGSTPSHVCFPPVVFCSTHWMNFSLGTTILFPIFRTGNPGSCISS